MCEQIEVHRLSTGYIQVHVIRSVASICVYIYKPRIKWWDTMNFVQTKHCVHEARFLGLGIQMAQKVTAHYS